MSLKIGLQADNVIKYRIVGSSVESHLNTNEFRELVVNPNQSVEVTSVEEVRHLTVSGNILSVVINVSELTSLNLSFAFLTAINNINITSDVEITDFIDMLKKTKIDVLTLNLVTIPNDLSVILNFTDINKINSTNVLDNIDDFRHSKVNDSKLTTLGRLFNLENTTSFKDARLINFENTTNLENISGKEIEINPLLNVIRSRDSKIVPFKYEQVIDSEIDSNYNFEMDLSNTNDYNIMQRDYTEVPSQNFNSEIESNYNFEMDLSTNIKDEIMVRNYNELPDIVFDNSYDANYNFEMDIIRPYIEQN